MGYYLGIDVGGSKTAALIASESGKALGISVAGPGNYELVGWTGFKDAVNDAVQQVLRKTNLRIDDISGIGSGISGYDWPSSIYHRSSHFDLEQPRRAEQHRAGRLRPTAQRHIEYRR